MDVTAGTDGNGAPVCRRARRRISLAWVIGYSIFPVALLKNVIGVDPHDTAAIYPLLMYKNDWLRQTVDIDGLSLPLQAVDFNGPLSLRVGLFSIL